MTQQGKKRSWDAKEKLRIVKLHLIEGKAVSEICEEYDIAPSVYYKWQSTLFENGADALERKPSGRAKQNQQQKELSGLRSELEKTQKKLADKHEVLSELMSEHVRLKKTIGD